MQIDRKTRQITPAKSWATSLKCGDVVLFRFPWPDNGLHRPPEARPCLLQNIRQIEEDLYLTLIAGRKAKAEPPQAHEIDIATSAEINSAGLTCPTRFDSRIELTISARHPGFEPGPDGTPIIGHFDNETKARLDADRV